MKSLLVAIAAMSAVFATAQCCEDGGCKDGAKPSSVAAREAEFLAEANRMMLAAEGKDACCKTTAAKAVAKGEPGCCNAKGEPAKFKVFAMGKYHYFGCADSAAKARQDLIAKGQRAGKVQKVSRRAAI